MTTATTKPPVLLFHNPRCSKSREALAALRARDLEFEVVDYLKSPPTVADLVALIAKLEGPPSSLLRTKESAFAALSLGANPSATEVAEAIAHEPVLLERPVLVVGARAAIGRPIERILALLE